MERMKSMYETATMTPNYESVHETRMYAYKTSIKNKQHTSLNQVKFTLCWAHFFSLFFFTKAKTNLHFFRFFRTRDT